MTKDMETVGPYITIKEDNGLHIDFHNMPRDKKRTEKICHCLIKAATAMALDTRLDSK